MILEQFLPSLLKGKKKVNNICVNLYIGMRDFRDMNGKV